MQRAGTEDARQKISQTTWSLTKPQKKIKLDKFSRRLATILSHRETQKNVLQQKKLEKSLEEKWKKTLNSKDNPKKLLQNYTSWGRLCLTVTEFQQILKEKVDQDFQIVKTELPYYRYTHKADKTAKLDLF